jgi:hypothetical protein
MTKRIFTLCGIVLMALFFVTDFSGTAFAQMTTGGIRGTVVAKDDGIPLAEAEVIVLHVPSGTTKSALTDGEGNFAFTGLRVGGPYRVTVNALSFEPEVIDDITLSAGKIRNLDVKARLPEEIIVIESDFTPKTTSSKTTVGAKTIAEIPSIGRDPKSVVRLTPEASVEGNSLSIAGANNRYNSVTVDGARQDDDFGLNANGYPTRRSPIGLGAIEEISVETTPFDVRYGRFLGGNVNIVTKSGSNDFHGSLFGSFANQSLAGDKTGSTDVDVKFKDLRYGALISGPIIKDKLHFVFSAEALNASTPVDVGPAGSGAVNEVVKVSSADVAEAQRIAREVYNFNAGEPSLNITEGDLKLLGKVDWTISSKHRATLRYQRTGGNTVTQSTTTETRLPLSSHWYDNKATLNNFTGRLLSDWTDRFSTDLEVSAKLVENKQTPLNGNGFMKAIINTVDGGQIFLGPDEFRHQNRLANDAFHTKAEASYLLGKHLISGGWEWDYLRIFNLFVPFSNGVAEYKSLADFAARNPATIQYSNAVSGNPEDGAANWNSSVNTLYLQDQFEPTSYLSLSGGLRFERYGASKSIELNEKFQQRYDFANNETINGKTILLPRLGVSFRPFSKLNVHGGVGLFAGGTPNVWVSNSYTNDGVTISSTTSDKVDEINGFDGRNIPDALKNKIIAGNGNVDATSASFRIPSTWKIGTGADYMFNLPGMGDNGKNVELKLNYTYNRERDGVRWVDLRRDLDSLPNNSPVGTLPDGRRYVQCPARLRYVAHQ